MSVHASKAYIGRFIRRKLGLGSFLPAAATAASNPTSLRVFNPELFDALGGTLFYVDQAGNDKYFTYTGINIDQLTGIPASGAGEIDADLYAFNETTNTPTLIFRGDIDDEELEREIDAFRVFVVEEMFDDASGVRKRWRPRLGWFDTTVEIRDDCDDSYNVVALSGSDTINYETGQVVFNTARSESRLWMAGFAYNPFYTIARLLMAHGNDSRFLTYLQVGQMAESKKDVSTLSSTWRKLGGALAFCRS